MVLSQRLDKTGSTVQGSSSNRPHSAQIYKNIEVVIQSDRPVAGQYFTGLICLHVLYLQLCDVLLLHYVGNCMSLSYLQHDELQMVHMVGNTA